MKRWRLSEEQIIAVLKEHEAGAQVGPTTPLKDENIRLWEPGWRLLTSRRDLVTAAAFDAR